MAPSQEYSFARSSLREDLYEREPSRHRLASPYPAQNGFLLSRGTGWTLLALLLVLTLWAATSLWYIVFRDELAARLLAQQARMQYAYESKIGELRARLDRVASQRLIEQDGVEGRLSQVVGRQMQIENRQSVLASIVGFAGGTATMTNPATTGSLQEQSVQDAASSGKPSHAPPLPFNLFAPLPQSSRTPSSHAPAKPVPEPDPFELRTRAPQEGHRAMLTPTILPSGPKPEEQIGRVEISLAASEAWQIGVLDSLVQTMRGEARLLRTAFSEIGLDPEEVETRSKKSSRSNVGGPFVPIAIDTMAGPFERLASQLQGDILLIERLRHATTLLPFRRPMATDSTLSSNFGPRIDPFTRAMAMHTGIDFRGDLGASVRATGAGEVVSAEFHGGYGNMVEIAHGHGVTTRYAHLSQILVTPGQRVDGGMLIGRVGSTGRSTGPHLHYETRIDGEAIDPMRFLRIGSRLSKAAL
jgi:hypothetical protein